MSLIFSLCKASFSKSVVSATFKAGVIQSALSKFSIKRSNKLLLTKTLATSLTITNSLSMISRAFFKDSALVAPPSTNS